MLGLHSPSQQGWASPLIYPPPLLNIPCVHGAVGSGGEAEGGSWPAGCGEPPPPIPVCAVINSCSNGPWFVQLGRLGGIMHGEGD